MGKIPGSRQKLILCGAALMALAGCLPADGGQTQDRMPNRQAVLLGGAVVVQAPEGYCVDDTSTRDHAKAGFVLMAGCDGLMGLPSGTMVPPAILTVSALLPQDGQGADATAITRALGEGEILDRGQSDGLSLIRVSDAKRVPEGSDPRHWRGAMAVNGAVLALAVYGNGDIADAGGKSLLQSLATATRTASANRAARVSTVAVASPRPAADTPAASPKNRKNLFQRLFN